MAINSARNLRASARVSAGGCGCVAAESAIAGAQTSRDAWPKAISAIAIQRSIQRPQPFD
jgi:hypothetical protein